MEIINYWTIKTSTLIISVSIGLASMTYGQIYNNENYKQTGFVLLILFFVFYFAFTYIEEKNLFSLIIEDEKEPENSQAFNELRKQFEKSNPHLINNKIDFKTKKNN